MIPVDIRNNSNDPLIILQRLLGKNKVNSVIDVGASIGDTSENFCNIFPNALVHAFEPYPPFQEFIRQKSVKNSRIKLVPFAMAKTSGDVVMHINQSEGTNSLLKPNIQGQDSVYGELLKGKGTIKIKATSLDDWIRKAGVKKVDILKLDIQGFELEALRGAEASLGNRQIMSIFCEVMFNKFYQAQAPWEELVSEISKHGFFLYNFFNHSFAKGQLLQADGLFFHESIIESVLQKGELHFHSHSNILFD